MKISSVEAELFLVDGQKDRQNGQADGRIDNYNKTISHPAIWRKLLFSLLSDPIRVFTSYVKAR